MTGLEHALQSTEQVNCNTCGSFLVSWSDAIGRTRMRCPKCDRLPAPRRRSPDDIALMPQGLVRLVPLPEIEEGQLRCQGCARGVDGDVRFCTGCESARAAARNRERARGINRCSRCTTIIPPGKGRPRKTCDDCLTPAEAADIRKKREWNDRQRALRQTTPPTLLEGQQR